MPSDTCAQMLAAARLYDRLQSLGYWEQLHCPRPLGYRPAFHPGAGGGQRLRGVGAVQHEPHTESPMAHSHYS